MLKSQYFQTLRIHNLVARENRENEKPEINDIIIVLLGRGGPDSSGADEFPISGIKVQLLLWCYD